VSSKSLRASKVPIHPLSDFCPVLESTLSHVTNSGYLSVGKMDEASVTDEVFDMREGVLDAGLAELSSLSIA